MSGGRCVDGECACERLDGPVDDGGAPPDIGSPDEGGEDVPPPPCDPATCDSACRSIGASGGECVGGRCQCDTGADADADADTPLDDSGAPDGDDGAADEAPVDEGIVDEGSPDEGAVDEGTIDDARPDEGVADEAREDARPDEGVADEAREDARPDEGVADEARDEAPIDEGVADEAPVDEGVADEAPVDEGVADEGPVDEGVADEAPIDEGVADEAGPEDTSTVTWGVPVCDPEGGTLRDRGLVGGPTTLVRTVSVPALGNGRVIRLDVNIDDRAILGIELPFDDLRVTLTSPAGAARTFWYHFYSDDTGGIFPDYEFPTPWFIPVWWDEPVGGTWTLTMQDDVVTNPFGGVPTELVSWCVTALDPAGHAAIDPGVPMSVCDTGSHDITDYCEDDPPDPCTDHPVQFEFMAPEFVRAGGGARLVIDLSHPDVSQLEIVVLAANGSEIGVWDRGPAAAWTPNVPLPTLSGVWMTGRWAIRITDMVEGGTGTLNGWCIEAN
jgi:subtilisin-like proprotein convertase family protein